jgi:hypothetical protein
MLVNISDHAGDRREGINQSVLQDVSSLFKGKNYDQLTKLEETIKHKIQFETGIDIGYWESLLGQLNAHMARARLRDKHQQVLYAKLNSLKKKQGIVSREDKTSRETKEKKPEQEERMRDEANQDDQEEDEFERRIQERIKREEENYKLNKMKSRERDEPMDAFDRKEAYDELAEANKIDQITKSMHEYDMGNYSPKLISLDDLPYDTFIITQEEDNKRLESKRNEVLGTGAVKPSVEDEFEAKARKSMGGILEDEAQQPEDGQEAVDSSSAGKDSKSNTQEIALDHHYLWSDKYRPRKPRYYNRVHTGYDWNQYNKKHYDIDNPPPKTVQGYKFNVCFACLLSSFK